MKSSGRPGYVLVPTLLILSALSIGYILQSRTLSQRLQTSKAVSKQELIDTIQIEGATAYYRDGQRVGANKKEGASYRVLPEKDRIQITIEGDQIERPLLQP